MLGISPQSVESHERFRERHGLNVPLLADPGKRVARAYGVLGPGGMRAQGGLPRGRRRPDPLPARGAVRAALPGRGGSRARRGRGGLSAVAAAKPEAERFELDAGGLGIAGEEVGEGPPVVLLHGITATRRYVVHGSLALPRAGHKLITYDARGHGESDPAPPGGGYGYEDLASDLGAVLSGAGGAPGRGRRPLARLPHHGDVRAGAPRGTRGRGLHRAGEPRPAAAGRGARPLGPAWRTASSRAAWTASCAPTGRTSTWPRSGASACCAITRERIGRHRNPHAFAAALREVPRSLPFEGMAELESLAVPALVVASHDDADPGHPYAVAEAWAEALPSARADQRGAGPDSSRLAGRPPLARDRGVLRAPRGGRAPQGRLSARNMLPRR